MIKNREDNFEIDYDNFEINKDLYFENKTIHDKKKSVGVFTKDLKINLIKNHPLFYNRKLIKHLLIPQSNFEKLKEEITKIDEMNYEYN